jgi:hypothetical protein
MSDEALQRRNGRVSRNHTRWVVSDPLAEVRSATARLRELAERLRAEDVSDEQAAALAREAAEVVSSAGNQIERALRDEDPERDEDLAG